MVKQPVRAFGPQKLTELRQFFTKNDCNVRKLIVEIIASSASIGQDRPADAVQDNTRWLLDALRES
jgi:hypothetical protein